MFESEPEVLVRLDLFILFCISDSNKCEFQQLSWTVKAVSDSLFA